MPSYCQPAYVYSPSCTASASSRSLRRLYHRRWLNSMNWTLPITPHCRALANNLPSTFRVLARRATRCIRWAVRNGAFIDLFFSSILGMLEWVHQSDMDNVTVRLRWIGKWLLATWSTAAQQAFPNIRLDLRCNKEHHRSRFVLYQRQVTTQLVCFVARFVSNASKSNPKCPTAE